MKRIDDADAELHLNAVVFGKTGSGKTSLGVTAPKPLILLSESQGILSVKQHAKRMKLPVPVTLLMEKLEDYRSVSRALRGRRDQPFRVVIDEQVAYEGDWPETVVLDSMTDLCEIVRTELREIAPQQTGKDGLPFDSMKFWGVFMDRVRNVVLAFRDAKVHTLFLCLDDDRTDGEGQAAVRTVQPAMAMKKMPGMLASAVNIQGMAYKGQAMKKGKPQTFWAVLFEGPEHTVTKRCFPLREVETPRFDRWVKAVCEHVKPTDKKPGPSMEEMQGDVSRETTPDESGTDAPKEQPAPEGKVA